jgi:hypothetical protein
MRPHSGPPPDRVPVMCQLALGHYFLHAEGGALEIWHDSDACAAALTLLAERYGFDGILVNLPGREPDWRREIRTVKARGPGQIIEWLDGRVTVAPPDDNPHVVDAGTGRPIAVAFADVDVDALWYVEPHDRRGVVCLTSFPVWHWDTLARVRQRTPHLSVHGEVFSPFSQLMELVGPMEGALALALDPGRVRAALERLTAGAVALAEGHAAAGADAVLISSAYAGAGFISPAHYEQFVLPCEAALVRGIKRVHPDLVVYTHTCGAIGDRLELMARTGTDGIDTLDPPPLGNVDLADAKARLRERLFIKGNVDPVNTVLRGSPERCYQDALHRIAIASEGGGYILSTACSVPPHAPPENILQLSRAARDAAGTR